MATQSHTSDLRVTPVGVKGRGASAVALECLCDGDIKGRVVGKFFKVPVHSKVPASVEHELRMLKASKGAPNIVQALGLYEVPSTTSLREALGFTDLPNVPNSISAHEDACLGERTVIYTLFMEKCDYALQDFDLLRFTESEAAFVGRSVLAALCYLHGLDIVHRDIKPANVFVGSCGDQIKLGDFGIACKLQTARGTVEDTLCGTHGFLAPECLVDRVFCKESDMFALGAMIYQLLFGTYAFIRGTDAETDIATCHGELPLIPCGKPVGKSDESCHLVRLLLEHRACDRPSAATAMQHLWFRHVDSLVTLRVLIKEKHLRNYDDDEEELPVTRRYAMGSSESLEAPYSPRTGSGGSLASLGRRFAALWSTSRVTKPFRRLRQMMTREKTHVPDFHVIVVPA